VVDGDMAARARPVPAVGHRRGNSRTAWRLRAYSQLRSHETMRHTTAADRTTHDRAARMPHRLATDTATGTGPVRSLNQKTGEGEGC
jgi:hypothetical protein